MIVLEGVRKKFKDIVLFENLNITFPENKKILIKGINGSGKSVLLKMLVGYSRPDKGIIKIDDVILGKDCDFIIDAGVSINAPEFMKNQTGLENLLYLANIRKKTDKENIIRWSELFDLKDSMNKKYKTYSLGMKQKMRIIQAMMENPKYLILDEPFDALDKKSQEKLMKVLDDYISSDKTLLFTSHNAEYEKFADIIYEIDECDLKIVKE